MSDQDPFQALRHAYRRSLATQIEALNVARDRLLRGDDDARASVKRLAHGLRGSGGTYGFTDLSLVAGRAEDAQGNSVFVAVDELLNELRRVAVQPDRSRAAVLIVQADPATASVLEMMVLSFTSRVTGVASAAEARAALTEHPYTLILLDLMLPDCDGRDFLVELRRDPTLRDVPVVVLTAAATPGIHAECLALGAHEVHEKPVEPVSLSTMVAAMIGHEHRTSLQLSGDPVTGLLDASFAREALASNRDSFQVHRKPWCVLGFSTDADDHDELRSIAAVLTKAFSEAESLVTRFGPKVFIAILPNTTPEEAELAAVRIQAASAGVAACGGVEAGDLDPPKVIALVQRMLKLSQLAGGRPVVTPLDQETRSAPTVLIVEDDLMVAEAVRAALKGKKFRVMHRPQGRELIKIAEKLRPRLILLDLGLPDIDGLTLLREIRRHPTLKTTPVAILTAYGTDRHIVEGLEAGADDYIVKPFSGPVLAARVETLVGRR